MYFFDGKEVFIQKITKEFISYPDLTGGSIQILVREFKPETWDLSPI